MSLNPKKLNLDVIKIIVVFILLGFIATLINLISSVVDVDIKNFTFLVFIIFVLIITLIIIQFSEAKKSEVINQKITDAESKVESQPEKVKPAWDLARVTLESYFNRNLSQVTSIFWLSVVVMCVGFGIIIWGISQAIQSQDVNTPAIITGVAGIITEFIGATFLFIYRSTIQQALDYSKTLERINSVGMAMQILDTMPDKTEADDLKSKTKAILVELLIRQAHNIPDDKKNSIPEKTEKA